MSDHLTLRSHRHKGRLSKHGIDVTSTRKLSEETLFMTLQAAGFELGVCCQIILAVKKRVTMMGGLTRGASYFIFELYAPRQRHY